MTIKAEYVDHMGNDLSIINAAKVSFNKQSSFETITFDTEEELDEWFTEDGQGYYDADYVYSDRWCGGYPVDVLKPADKNLVRFLARGFRSEEWDNIIADISTSSDHEYIESIVKQVRKTATHWTPFAHTAISIRCAAPVPIRTQAFKHVIGLVANEESRRYIDCIPEIYIPEFRERPQGSIKQGSGGLHPDNDTIKAFYTKQVKSAVSAYEALLSQNVAPEQARFVLPQGAIVNWIWTGNLVSFANFFNKRSDSHSQQEIRELAQAFDKIIRPLFPVAWSALVD